MSNLPAGVDEAMVERAVEALDFNDHLSYRRMALAALTAALGDTHCVVPKEPSEAMWGGLARAIVMWTRFSRPSEQALLRHLKASGETIPDWLSAECRDVDHVPPKGSVAVWIYRAMIAASTSGEK
jgi:hypothetical protein